MDTFTVAVTILFSFVVVFLPFLFRAGSEGRLRRGAGWYLDVRDRSEGPLPAHRRPPRTSGASRRMIRIWVMSGLALLVLGVVAWVVADVPGLGIIVGLLGVCYLGMAIESSRENRWARPTDE